MRREFWISSGLLLALTFLGVSAGSAASRTTADCRVEVPSVAIPALPEASGVASSRRTPGLLWSHADSGSAPLLVALDARGTVRGKVRLSGATLVDWEDIAVGGCGSSSCVYAADIGDNNGRRKAITIYRTPEPLASDGTTGPVEAFVGHFPDAPQDAEAFFVRGDGEMYIVTKGDSGPVALYRFPKGAKPGTQAATLEKLGVLQAGRIDRNQWVTGASASPDGRWVALRTHGSVAFYEADKLVKGDFSAASTFALSGLRQAQGEGVALGPKGAVFLVGEGGGRGKAGVFGSLACKLPG